MQASTATVVRRAIFVRANERRVSTYCCRSRSRPWTPQLVKGFGRRPVARRWCEARGRRSKASQGGNRGEEGRCVRDATYGDLRIADRARLSRRWPVRRSLAGGTDKVGRG